MGPRHRPVTTAVLGGCMLLVAAGCAAGTAGASLDRATGAVLADGADRLAEALEAEDACRALQEADALRERALRALEAGDAPDAVVAETTRVVDATTATLTCEVEAAGEQDAADEPDEPADEQADEQADEADQTSQAPAPSPSPDAPTEQEPTKEKEEKESDGGGGQSGPGQGQGPDGDGPPGHRDDRGEG